MRSAIEDCHAAGIRVVVITGDNKLTAEAICRAIGVFTEEQALNGSSMTGLDFAGLPESGGCWRRGGRQGRSAAGSSGRRLQQAYAQVHDLVGCPASLAPLLLCVQRSAACSRSLAGCASRAPSRATSRCAQLGR